MRKTKKELRESTRSSFEILACVELRDATYCFALFADF